MKFRFVSSTVHGFLDYAAALALIVVPSLLGFGDSAPLAYGLSLTAGAALATYSLFTDYRLGVLPVLSYRGHLALDLASAAAFVAIPFLFEFEGQVAAYFWANAAGVILAVAISSGPRALFGNHRPPALRNGRLNGVSS